MSHARREQRDHVLDLYRSAADGGAYIKLTARPDGSFTMKNGRNGFTKEYKAISTGATTSSR